jgi:hypothetical protein
VDDQPIVATATAAADNNGGNGDNGGDPGDTLGPDIDSTLLGTRADQVDGTTLTITFTG